jgi:hypothetical protein
MDADKLYEACFVGEWTDNADVLYYIDLEMRIRSLEAIQDTNNGRLFIGGNHSRNWNSTREIVELRREQKRIKDYNSVRESALRRMNNVHE